MRHPFLLLVLVAGRLTAQDSTCQRTPAADTVPALIVGRLTVAPSEKPLPATYLESVLVVVRQSIRLTEPWRVQSFEPAGRDTASLAASTTVQFDIRRDGTIDHVGRLASSLSDAFDSTILDAVRRADSAHLFLPLPKSGGHHTRVRLTAYLSSNTRSVPVKDAVVAPLLQTALPRWTDVAATGTVPGNVPPDYPEEARRANVQDTVTAIFVVDESGTPMRGTMYIERATYRNFARSVWKFLSAAKFRTASVGGCPAKMLVEMPFVFSLSH